MLFNTFSFLIFFPVVLIIYFVIPKKIRYIWLLIASYFFYMSWSPKYGLLLLFSTAVTYAGGIVISRTQSKGKRVTTLILCLVANFGLLFFFKYLMFSVDTVISILARARIAYIDNPFSIVLPMGISFYIFQAVGYLIDVYRGQIDAEKNFAKYALFVSFFPQLVAGPIERSGNLLSQVRHLEEIKLWNSDRIRDGLMTMLYGYFLKMIISDRAKIFVDAVYHEGDYAIYFGFVPIIATVLFAIQIYTDFAGYTYIAIGAAKIMGIDLMNNFNTPYLAVNISDFWARWHISLTNWFRDYLYIPLGGNRKGKVRKYINIFIVFLLSGLWHGASWHFVAWGVIHGLLRIVDDLTRKGREKVYSFFGFKDDLAFKIYKITGTFIFVCLAWVFFRAQSVNQAFAIIRNMFHWNPWVLTDGSLFEIALDAKEFNVLIVALVLLLVADICIYRKINLIEIFAKQNWVFKGLAIVFIILSILVFGIYGANYDAASFIYFQF